jgi:phytoene dehydrogenase-like protein
VRRASSGEDGAGAPPQQQDSTESGGHPHHSVADASSSARALSRRTFLVALAAPALVGLTRKSPPKIVGGFVDDGGALGHRLRDRASWPTASRVVRTPVVIVGGGIAGLSAAWWLRRKGFDDFVVLELEREAGGNSRWGENEDTRFPWGAHYVPIPGPGATLVRTLFEDLGVLRDGVWNEEHLAFAPRERLLVHGEWQPDVEPSFALPKWERDEFDRFHERMSAFRDSGEFTVPTWSASASLRRTSSLDDQTMANWLQAEGFRSSALRWYVDYACRDDYGAMARDTSAWAGIHYFAARPESDDGPLTWPEGNGFIVRALLERVGERVVTGAPVYRIESTDGADLRVRTPRTDYLTDIVIAAVPSFVASRLLSGGERATPQVYSPWLTANIALSRPPRERRGTEPSWDNVIYESPSLGYVTATHQSLRTHTPRPMWTYYHALADRSPSDGRRLLQRRTWQHWVDWVLADLARAHPDIHECVERVDVLRMGHAMVRPVPGFLGLRSRPGARDARGMPSFGGRLLHAHSDASGLSLFEEAQWQGVQAADQALRALAK